MAKADTTNTTERTAPVIDFCAYRKASEAQRAQMLAFEPSEWPDTDFWSIGQKLDALAFGIKAGARPERPITEILHGLALNSREASSKIFTMQRLVRKAERKRAKKKWGRK
jgi:hypothetical protein